MESLQDPMFLSRLQFSVTAMFHILWPLTTVGISLILVIFEGLWLKTGDVDHYRHARFWAQLFLLNFSVGVISGIPLEFEFGTNWSRFAMVTGEFFGNILGYEGAMAFMLEAGFLGIMLFGWMRVPPVIHLLATCMVALGASLSAFWIMVANSWMQTPAGIHLENNRVVVDSYFEAIFTKSMPWGVLHMWFACVTTSLFVIGGLSAWYILKKRNADFFLKSFKLALIGVIFVTPVQLSLGHGSGREIFANQPAKGAAIEAHWTTNQEGKGAAWNLLSWPNQMEQKNAWALSIPNGLSVLVTGDRHGQVQGLKSFPQADQPPAIPLIFYSFRVMVVIGLVFMGLIVWTSVAWLKGQLSAESICINRWLLRAWIASIPLGYVATECGWIVREVGRQPWIIYGLLRTRDAASTLPASVVAVSLVTFVIIYSGLFILFLIFAARILQKGPNLTLMPPS
ncbi:cytochrome ubiquinol oxidase subunit I [Methylobacter sp.]|uniref:cytochrome ubiquinol oxidase subunit I n=1 Tax=Methylobacter sp. TaxID=2051955 RepID=UPI00120D0B57|nr:cytochrome ubiquinol oxidase subunit I [Methylobacter sp.]TAK60001.1 MAG: cytochrome ubiquinol oxidase subunit I [Methylobacter sp.]